MMLKWTTALAVLVLVAVSASADEFIEPFSPLWGWNPPKVIGKVKTIAEKRYFLNGAAATQPKDLPDGVRNTFDDRGRIVEQAGLAPSNGKPYPPTTIKFDDKGRRTEIVFRSFSGDVNGSHVMTWDADGLGAKLVVNDAQNPEHKNVIRDTGDLTFDAQGRVTRIKYNQAGGGSRYFFYSYAPEGRLDSILTATKPDPAEATAKVTYKYNDKGFVAEEEQSRGQMKFGPLGAAATVEWKPAQKMEYTYEYDAQGNWVKRIEHLYERRVQRRRQAVFPDAADDRVRGVKRHVE